MVLSWPVFVDAYVRNEVSTNAGGLTIWPARLMVPVGFFLLIMPPWGKRSSGPIRLRCAFCLFAPCAGR